MIHDAKQRLEVLRRLLEEGELSTQEELREKLEKQEFAVTQSTVSRDLRKLGAVRAVDGEGRTVYRLSEGLEPPMSKGSFGDLVREISSNGSLIIIHTAVGSASLVARRLDNVSPNGILGTIAGDDTVFVAPASADPRELKNTIRAIRDCLSPA